MVRIIVAKSKNGVIGNSNKLIWHLPADLINFKKITTGHPIVMGRKTYQSIGRPLPNRRNIIITRDKDFNADGCDVVNSIEEALLLTNSDCFIIGGGDIYKQAIPLTQKIYLTLIDSDFEGDTFFPELDVNWFLSSEQNFCSDEKNTYNYSFLTYERYQF
jgi:dihydrofolate reductase